MKRAASLTAALLLSISLAACNGDKDDDVDLNPDKGNDVCQGDSCGDEKGDDR